MEEIILYCRHCASLTFFVLRGVITVFINIIIAAIPPMLIFGIVTSFKDVSYLISVIVGVALFCLFLFLLVSLVTCKQISKISKASYMYPKYRFTDSGIDYKSFNYLAGINAFVPYKALRRVYFDKNKLILFARKTLVFAISRHDIDAESEKKLILLFQSKLSPKVFKQKTVPKMSKSNKLETLANYVQPMFKLPEVKVLPHQFNKNDEIYFKQLKLKNNKPKKINTKLHMALTLAFALGFFCLLVLAYFLTEKEPSVLRLAFFFLTLFSILCLLFYINLKGARVDALGRDNKNIIVSINEFYINYKITSLVSSDETVSNSQNEEFTSFYYALSELQSVKETEKYFAFFVGNFQPMLISKEHLDFSQVELIRTIIFSSYGNKYSYYGI